MRKENEELSAFEDISNSIQFMPKKEAIPANFSKTSFKILSDIAAFLEWMIQTGTNHKLRHKSLLFPKHSFLEACPICVISLLGSTIKKTHRALQRLHWDLFTGLPTRPFLKILFPPNI